MVDICVEAHVGLVAGDLSAREMTMSDEDRIQLMLLVKEGKISVQEAVDTVSKHCILPVKSRLRTSTLT